MTFTVNIERVIYMAVNTEKRHLNYHFLAKLLQVIVRKSELDEYNMEFYGFDALRAKDVYRGKSDIGDGPLNRTALKMKEIAIDRQSSQLAESISSSNIELSEISNPLVEKETLSDKLISKEFELKAQIDTLTENIQSLNSKISEIEGVQEELKTQVNKNHEVSKEIIEDECHHNLLKIFDSLPENNIIKEENARELMKNIVSSRIRISKIEHTVNALTHTVDQTLAKIEEMERIKRLKYDANSDDEDDAESSVVENDQPIAKSFILNGNNMIDDWLDLLKPKEVTTFQNEIGMKPKKKELKAKLTVRAFKPFFDDYEKKFEAIYNLLWLQKEIIKVNKMKIEHNTGNKVHVNDFTSLKRDLLSRCSKIESDIKHYISRDPEALGIASYVKPVRMRTTQTTIPPRPTKIPLKPYPKDRLSCNPKKPTNSTSNLTMKNPVKTSNDNKQHRDKRLNDAPKLFSVYTRKNDKKASDLIEWAHSQL